MISLFENKIISVNINKTKTYVIAIALRFSSWILYAIYVTFHLKRRKKR